MSQTNKQSNGLTVKENSLRLLAVIYSLSGGQAGVQLHMPDVLEECARVGVFRMTHEEFAVYRQKIVDDAHALDAEFVADA